MAPGFSAWKKSVRPSSGKQRWCQGLAPGMAWSGRVWIDSLLAGAWKRAVSKVVLLKLFPEKRGPPRGLSRYCKPFFSIGSYQEICKKMVVEV